MACTYPACDCAVSFPEGYKPSAATQCPQEAPPATTVFVVMGNDYPAAVFTTAEAAEAFCAERRKLPSHIRIYWQSYPLPLTGAQP